MQRYGHLAPRFLENMRSQERVTSESVFQEGNKVNRALVEEVLADLMLPGSTLLGFRNLQEAYERAQRGESCLITMEHYSNFDLPNLFYLLRQQGADGEKVADSIVAMAAMKLNEEDPFVRAFTDGYTRIVIYPARGLEAIEDPEVYARERRRSSEINRAALHELVRCKNQGYLVLVFPAGTRYRPGVPESKRGIAQIDSYMKRFDWVCPVGIGGNLLHVNPSGKMSEDWTNEDVLVYKVGELIDAPSFRAYHRAGAPEGVDPKQHVVDQLMAQLEEIHEEVESYRRPLLEQAAESP